MLCPTEFPQRFEPADEAIRHRCRHEAGKQVASHGMEAEPGGRAGDLVNRPSVLGVHELQDGGHRGVGQCSGGHQEKAQREAGLGGARRE